jgi:hypothetical protein
MNTVSDAFHAGSRVNSSDAARLRVTATADARRELEGFGGEAGPQVLLLSWPPVAVSIPARLYAAGPTHVTLGHIAGCPVQADLRQLRHFGAAPVVLDVARRRGACVPIVLLRSIDGAAGWADATSSKEVVRWHRCGSD